MPIGEAPSRAKMIVHGGDIIVSTTRPHRGAIAQIRNEHDGDIASTGFAVLRDIKQDCLPAFLLEAISTSLVLRQFLQRSSGGNYPAITPDEIDKTLIPLPALKFQGRLVAEIQAAREARTERLQRADQLLASLDSYLLDILGFKSLPRDARNTFATRLRNVRRDDRLSADYFHPERIRAIKMLHTTTSTRLADIVDFKRDQCLAEASENYIGLAHVQSDTGEVVLADEEASGQCFAYQADDVLFARLRPYLNKVHRAERAGVCSTEFHVMHIRDQSRVLPDYLATMLRSSLIVAQTCHMMTGNTHPRLANQDVVNLIIPIPSREVQEEIATELHRRRAEARRLRADAEADWAAAKLRFEQQLLNRDSQPIKPKSESASAKLTQQTLR